VRFQNLPLLRLWADSLRRSGDACIQYPCLLQSLSGSDKDAKTPQVRLMSTPNLFRLRTFCRAQWLALLRHAVFGTDSLRFSVMFFTFTALYKFLLNAFPILIPSMQPSTSNLPSPFDEEEKDSPSSPESGLTTPGLLQQRAPRLSLSAHAQMVLVRKRTRRWHSALAGAISGGLAVLCEKRSRRAVIAQQLFVRSARFSFLKRSRLDSATLEDYRAHTTPTRRDGASASHTAL
jgi:hypothetical protein